MRGRLSSFGVDPYELSLIDQTKCPGDADETNVNININDDTFSPQNIAGVVRKAGEKIGTSQYSLKFSNKYRNIQYGSY